jgi:dihydrofolate reductase
MGIIVAAEFVTLDGVMEAPAWTGPYFNDELAKLQSDLLFDSDALLLGRVTYEGFAASWPKMEQTEGEFAVRMNTMPKHVASRTLTQLEWNASLLQGDVPDAVAELKRGDGALLVYGSAGLLNTLLRHNLVDRYRLMTFPVVQGSGKRLFSADIEPRAFRPISSTTTGSGVVVTDYEPA